MKTALITGADGGMGTEITREVAKAGYHVIMVCIDEVHGHEVRDMIAAETGNKEIEVRQCDLSNLKQVSGELAQGLLSTESHIDLLMHNAGTMQERRNHTADGFEKTVAVNYMAPVVLTERLQGLLHKGSRVVFMVSLSADWGSITYPRFFTAGSEGSFWRIFVYSNSKLALTLYALKKARDLAGQGIMVNGADPGVVSTPIIRMNMWFDPITDLVYRPLIRTPRQGADTAIHLLLSPEMEEQTGGIYHSRKKKKLGKKYNETKQEELWRHTWPLIKAYL